jgi:signal transduction histidine kinase
MSLRSRLKLPRTVVLRLTAWFAGTFALGVLLIFFLVYLSIKSNLEQVVDNEMLGEAKKYYDLYTNEGLDVLRVDMKKEEHYHGADHVFFRILHPVDKVFYSSDVSSWGPISIHVDLEEHDFNEGPLLETVLLSKHDHFTRVLYARLDENTLLQMGQSLQTVSLMLSKVRITFSATMIFLFLLGTLSGWFIVRGALAGVGEITKTASEIAEGDLHKRVPVGTQGDEIDCLAETFNTMLDRIQTLMQELEEMSDNIAHDLRSPITRIRGLAETTATEHTGNPALLNLAGDVVEDCDHLLGFINAMLDLSETEAGMIKFNKEPFDLSAFARKITELYQPAAEDQQISLLFKADDTCMVDGDGPRLNRVLVNLLDNALKNVSPGGTITVAVRRERDRSVLSVEDDGVGICEKDLPHIFSRFYRTDRSRGKGGHGLGLSLAKAIVHSHGGDLTVESIAGQGASFFVTL